MMEYEPFKNCSKTLLEYRDTENYYAGIDFYTWKAINFETFIVTENMIFKNRYETLKAALLELLNECKIDELIYIDPIVWEYIKL